MSTQQTDAYWNYQEQVRIAFMQLVANDTPPDFAESRQWLIDADKDGRISSTTLAWCESYLVDYAKEVEYMNEVAYAEYVRG